jgi:hypothetical protein
MAHYDGVVLSVHFTMDDWSTVEGSAVMIAPGIAVAAAHVIEPKMHLSIFCVGYTPSGPRFWRVGGVKKVGNTDLVILLLIYASALPLDNRFVQAAITTRLPGIGEQVMVAGLRASDEFVPADEYITFSVRGGRIIYGANVRIGVGEVTQYFLDGRGSMPPGPAVEVACSTPGGLSGGPAFDQNGRVVGILSSSLDHADGRGPSIISLLWPALVAEISPTFLPEQFPANIRLLEFGPCVIDRRDVIRWSIDEKGDTRIEYDGGNPASAPG